MEHSFDSLPVLVESARCREFHARNNTGEACYGELFRSCAVLVAVPPSAKPHPASRCNSGDIRRSSRGSTGQHFGAQEAATCSSSSQLPPAPWRSITHTFQHSAAEYLDNFGEVRNVFVQHIFVLCVLLRHLRGGESSNVFDHVGWFAQQRGCEFDAYVQLLRAYQLTEQQGLQFHREVLNILDAHRAEHPHEAVRSFNRRRRLLHAISVSCNTNAKLDAGINPFSLFRTASLGASGALRNGDTFRL